MMMILIPSFFTILGIIVFSLHVRKVQKNSSSEWVVYSSLVVMISGIFGVLSLFSAQLSWLVVLFSTATGVFCALLVMKKIQYPEYFVVKDVKNIDLLEGKITVIHEIKPQNSILFYQKELAGGKEGLFISRLNKDHVHSSYPDILGTTLWLSAETGADVNPTDLEEISYIMNDFIGKHKEKTVILLDGFTFLVNYHDFMKVMHLFQILKDKVSKENALLIMPLEEKTLTSDQVKMINTEFEVV